MACKKTCFACPDFTCIPGGLRVGAKIIVRGRVSCNACDGFHIHLRNGKAKGCDIAFHFNPRTSDQSVRRNSFSGCWQQPEMCIPYFPFAKGSEFTVQIKVKPCSYVVKVNCQYFAEYKHRLPYQNVRYLKLSKGAEYYESTIQNPCM